MNPFNRLRRALACIAALCLVCGCAAQRQPAPRAGLAQPAQLPQAEPGLAQQCAVLNTAQTRTLLGQLAGQNLEIQTAWARVRRAQAQEQQRAAARLPQLNLNFQGERSARKLTQFGPLAPGDAFIIEQFDASLAATYELDLWQRLAHSAKAAQWQTRAQRTDARAMAVSLSAQLLESWFDLSFQLRQRQLIEAQAEAANQLLALLKQRFLLGAGSALDALQQKQQVLALHSALANNQAEITLRREQLAVLLGRAPDTALAPPPDPLPELARFNPSLSFSAAALARRPDLHSAFYRLQAADASLAAALAERLPSVRFSAALSTQSENLADLFDGLLWRVAGALIQPLYAGGRIRAAIAEQRAARDMQLFQYRQSWLDALEELSAARLAEQREAIRVDKLSEQERIATRSYRLARQQYLRGTLDYLRVLNAQQSLIDMQQERLRAQRQRVSFRIQWCRALGIGWLADE